MTKEEIQNIIEETNVLGSDDKKLYDMEDCDFFDKHFKDLNKETKYFITSRMKSNNNIFNLLIDSYIEQFYRNQLEIDMVGLDDSYHKDKKEEMLQILSQLVYILSDEIYDLKSYISERQKDIFLTTVCIVESSYIHQFTKDNDIIKYRENFDRKKYDEYMSKINYVEFNDDYNIIKIIEGDIIYQYG